jgi:hypothetical protein
MTQLLEQAFAKAAKLPVAEQDAVASFMLAELESEQRWAQSFAASQDKLAQMADKALHEFKAGKTRPLDLDRDFPHE